MSIESQILKDIQAHGCEAHDIRGRMPTRGNYQHLGLFAPHKVVHYTAVWRERNTLQADISSWVGHANYHVNTQGWPGIAYAIGISPSGRVFILRNIDRMGYHAFNSNGIAYGVSTDMTINQVPTPELLRSLNVVLRVLDDRLGGTRMANTWGHQEMKWHDARNAGTSCPGNHLLGHTRTYRGGKDFALDAQKQLVPARPTHAKLDVPGYGERWIVQPMFGVWSKPNSPIHIYGYPVTGMYGHGSENIQFFERAIFRAQGNNVTLDKVGTEVFLNVHGDSHPAYKRIPEFKETSETRRYVHTTGHSLSYGFLSYYRKHGGWEQFGEPITEEFVENGKTVQYFERARFEHHPGTDPGNYDVVLGRVGAEAYAIRALKED